MNRRQFLGASLAGLIAALCLPFERFAEWCKAWLPKAPRGTFQGIEREFLKGVRVISDPNCPRGRMFALGRLGAPNTAWLNPRDYVSMRAALA